MLTATVFEDEEVLAYDKQVRVVRLPAPGLAGQTLVDAAVRTETGCTVVAVAREDGLQSNLDPAAFVFEADDEVVIAGTDEHITAFERQFGDGER
jgi:K+/H+ antiporter YhaU regulatory subunit KhtT